MFLSTKSAPFSPPVPIFPVDVYAVPSKRRVHPMDGAGGENGADLMRGKRRRWQKEDDEDGEMEMEREIPRVGGMNALLGGDAA